MSEVTTTIDPTTGGLKIAWSSAVSNSETITAYKIEILDVTDTTWSQDLTNCNGANAVIMSNLYCIVPMSTLIASPFNYLYGDLVQIRISAQNTHGWSPVSSTNTLGETVRTKPVQMNTPTRGTSTTISQIQVNWVALTANADKGGSTILSYHLQWDQGTNTYVDLIGFSTESTAITYTVTSGITGGQTYKFKVRAKNLYGWGDYSAEASIIAAQEPA